MVRTRTDFVQWRPRGSLYRWRRCSRPPQPWIPDDNSRLACEPFAGVPQGAQVDVHPASQHSPGSDFFRGGDARPLADAQSVVSAVAAPDSIAVMAPAVAMPRLSCRCTPMGSLVRCGRGKPSGRPPAAIEALPYLPHGPGWRPQVRRSSADRPARCGRPVRRPRSYLHEIEQRLRLGHGFLDPFFHGGEVQAELLGLVASGSRNADRHGGGPGMSGLFEELYAPCSRPRGAPGLARPRRPPPSNRFLGQPNRFPVL